MLFRQIFDRKLAQYAYLIGCQRTKEAILIDPERDIDQYVKLATQEGVKIVAVTETHIHADFLSGCREFAEQHRSIVYLSGDGDEDWQYSWLHDGDYDCRLVHHGDSFMVGNIGIEVVHTPGHTPEHIAFLVTDKGGGADEPMGMVSGDFVFVGDVGRPDLLESAAGVPGAMEPAARRLYDSIQSFLTLPDYLQIWPGHGAGSVCGKALGAVPETTVGYERRFNPAIRDAIAGKSTFVEAILDGQPEPPPYFARMKVQNKLGPAILGQLPEVKHISPADMADAARRPDAVVLDARLDRIAFMNAHLAGALYCPFNKQFNTTAGCYVEETSQIYLILDEEYIEEAVRDLVRIGLDHIAGYASLAEMESSDLMTSSIETARVMDLDHLVARGDVAVLDARRLAEFEVGHFPDAINVAHTRLSQRLDELPDDKTYAVHCRSGSRAAVASAMLASRGRKVIYVEGEIAEWMAANRNTAAV